MDILLIAGLDGSAWDAVAARLWAAGHSPAPVTLPGQAAQPSTAALEDECAAVLATVDAAIGAVMVVGHSAACTLAWMAADARPNKVARVVLIGGFPSTDREAYADFFEIVNGFMPFPGWAPFNGADSADLNPGRKLRIASAAIPVPEAVAKGTVHLSDERRFDVPVILICPEFSPTQAKEWIDGGKVPEPSTARYVEYVDIESGHWPMFSRPAELADLLAETADA
jgi:pimeloyl-ACP methyl ester carboxylesterase